MSLYRHILCQSAAGIFRAGPQVFPSCGANFAATCCFAYLWNFRVSPRQDTFCAGSRCPCPWHFSYRTAVFLYRHILCQSAAGTFCINLLFFLRVAFSRQPAVFHVFISIRPSVRLFRTFSAEDRGFHGSDIGIKAISALKFRIYALFQKSGRKFVPKPIEILFCLYSIPVNTEKIKGLSPKNAFRDKNFSYTYYIVDRRAVTRLTD